MKLLILPLCALLFAAGAAAKLPALSPDAKAKADEAAAKAAWSDKVAGFKLCQSMDRVADAYYKSAKAKGLQTHAPQTTPPCTDPGPFAAAGAASSPKPLEQSGAHSPAATAKSPPGSQATEAELSSKKKP